MSLMSRGGGNTAFLGGCRLLESQPRKVGFQGLKVACSFATSHKLPCMKNCSHSRAIYISEVKFPRSTVIIIVFDFQLSYNGDPKNSKMQDNTVPTKPSGKRILFTGGSGKAGRHVIPYLLAQGHKVLNVDLVPFPDPAADIYTLKADLTESGQTFNVLTSHFNMSDYEAKTLPQPPDVVIHFAAYPRNMIVPDNETFQANVTSTYNVIEAGK